MSKIERNREKNFARVVILCVCTIIIISIVFMDEITDKTKKIMGLSEKKGQETVSNEDVNELDMELKKEEETDGIIYEMKSCTDENTVLTKAVLSETSFNIEIATTTDKINYEALNEYDGESIYNMIAIQKEYIENENGERFEPAKTNDGDEGYGVSEYNELLYYQTFNMTSENVADILTVYLSTNKGEEIIIELEKQ